MGLHFSRDCRGRKEGRKDRGNGAAKISRFLREGGKEGEEVCSSRGHVGEGRRRHDKAHYRYRLLLPFTLTGPGRGTAPMDQEAPHCTASRAIRSSFPQCRSTWKFLPLMSCDITRVRNGLEAGSQRRRTLYLASRLPERAGERAHQLFIAVTFTTRG